MGGRGGSWGKECRPDRIKKRRRRSSRLGAWAGVCEDLGWGPGHGMDRRGWPAVAAEHSAAKAYFSGWQRPGQATVRH